MCPRIRKIVDGASLDCKEPAPLLLGGIKAVFCFCHKFPLASIAFVRLNIRVQVLKAKHVRTYDMSYAGTWVCAVGGLPLFSTAHKFESGTGWPRCFLSLSLSLSQISRTDLESLVLMLLA
jgi:hypothetical protein